MKSERIWDAPLHSVAEGEHLPEVRAFVLVQLRPLRGACSRERLAVKVCGGIVSSLLICKATEAEEQSQHHRKSLP